MFFVRKPHVRCDVSMDDEYKPNEGKKTKPGKEDDAEPTPPPAKKAKTKDEEKEDAEPAPPPAKKARTERPPCFIDKTFMFDDTFHIQIFGDSATVISWMNMRSVGEGVLYPQVRRMRSIMHQMWTQLNFGPLSMAEDIFQWTPRRFNVTADELADIGCLTGNRILEQKPIRACSRFFRVHFDGSAQQGKIGGGWFLEQVWARCNGLPEWHSTLKVAISIPTTILPATAIAAETMACCEAMLAILNIVEKGYVTLTPRCRVLPAGRLTHITHPRLS